MSANPTEQKQLPTYLNAECIRQALEKALPQATITIIELEIKLSSSNGGNFCSDIYRVRVRYQANNDVREERLLLKDMIMAIADIGSNEYGMYQKVLPAMEDILANESLKPRCLLMDRKDKELYILEDLNARGYQIANRFLGLDFEHSKLLMQKIAKFHAASMIYIERFPKDAADLQVSHFVKSSADAIGNAIAIGGLKFAIKIISQWEDYEEIVEKIEKSILNFCTRMKTLASNPSKNKVNVINHGDLWLNNFLYSYDEQKKPQDVIFVDFQNCFVGSPGFDINHFLYTSVQLNVIKESRFELLRSYYKTLKNILKLHGAKTVPTWQYIMEEVRKCEFVGFYAAMCELPICCMSEETADGFTAATFCDPKAMETKNELMYSNPRVWDTLRYALDHFNELGVLD